MTKQVHYKQYKQPVFYNDTYFDSVDELLDKHPELIGSTETAHGSERIRITDDPLEMLDTMMEPLMGDYNFDDDRRPCEFVPGNAIYEFKDFYRAWTEKHDIGFWGEDFSTVVTFESDGGDW